MSGGAQSGRPWVPQVWLVTSDPAEAAKLMPVTITPTTLILASDPSDLDQIAPEDCVYGCACGPVSKTMRAAEQGKRWRVVKPTALMPRADGPAWQGWR